MVGMLLRRVSRKSCAFVPSSPTLSLTAFPTRRRRGGGRRCHRIGRPGLGAARRSLMEWRASIDRAVGRRGRGGGDAINDFFQFGAVRDCQLFLLAKRGRRVTIFSARALWGLKTRGLGKAGAGVLDFLMLLWRERQSGDDSIERGIDLGVVFSLSSIGPGGARLINFARRKKAMLARQKPVADACSGRVGRRRNRRELAGGRGERRGSAGTWCPNRRNESAASIMTCMSERR